MNRRWDVMDVFFMLFAVSFSALLLSGARAIWISVDNEVRPKSCVVEKAP